MLVEGPHFSLLLFLALPLLRLQRKILLGAEYATKDIQSPDEVVPEVEDGVPPVLRPAQEQPPGRVADERLRGEIGPFPVDYADDVEAGVGEDVVRAESSIQRRNVCFLLFALVLSSRSFPWRTSWRDWYRARNLWQSSADSIALLC
jgi:hypothetical protein